MASIAAYTKLMRLDKPVGTLLLLWPTWSALWLASNGRPEWRWWLIYTLGTVIMRSAGCVINDWADRAIDGHVDRTCQRPLATQQLHPNQALKLFAMLIVLAATLLLWTNWLTCIAAIPAVCLATLYPFTKRFFAYPQAVLGLAFAWSTPMVFLSITGTVPLWVGLWTFGVWAWVVAFDTAYAMVDLKDDLQLPIFTTAKQWGEKTPLRIGQCCLVAALAFAGCAVWQQFSLPASLAIFAVCLSFVWQWHLVNQPDASQWFRAFKANQWAGLLLWLASVMA